MSWETQLPTRVSWYWQVPALYLESWGPQPQPLGLNHTAPHDDCDETNECWLSVSSHIHNVSRSWALITRAEITKPLQRVSTWIMSVFKADNLRKSSLVQRGGSGSSYCWGKERCRQIYQLLHFGHPTHPVHPVPLAAEPAPHSGLPLRVDALKPHTLAQQITLPVCNISEQSEILVHSEWEHREPSHSAAHIRSFQHFISSTWTAEKVFCI